MLVISLPPLFSIIYIHWLQQTGISVVLLLYRMGFYFLSVQGFLFSVKSSVISPLPQHAFAYSQGLNVLMNTIFSSVSACQKSLVNVVPCDKCI